ncbi:MAG: hypothetical protein HFI29_02390 [Lachnospiraceae bacterium]|jgi:uncharacterized protein YneF (UPF0154 family)|nr:hypothetical protein [Lachnospiraceae bacterium]
MKKVILVVVSLLTGIVAGAGAVGKIMGNSLTKSKRLSDKHLALFLMMNQWVKVKQEGKHLTEYFEKNGYKKIAIYGMSYAGETLLDELKDTNVVVAYGIDENADKIYLDVDIVTLEERVEAVDVVVVTAITFFDEIEKKLMERLECPIVSLEDILFEI